MVKHHFFHKLQVTILLLLVPVGGLYLYAKNQNIPFRDIFAPGTPVVHVGEIPMTVEIVSSDSERAKGLSGRTEMKTAGMLFVFETSERHGIWMKDMLFPIDIIWIDESLTVVAIDQGVRPDTYPKTFRPPVPVRYAIETEERYADTFGIVVGDKVRLPLRIDVDK
jgi:uncharacterized membrane protein (UPF0127 family)